MRKPDLLYVSFRGRSVRIRHHDPQLRPYTPTADRIGAILTIVSDVEGLRRALATTIADRYAFQVLDDGSEVRLRRLG